MPGRPATNAATLVLAAAAICAAAGPVHAARQPAGWPTLARVSHAPLPAQWARTASPPVPEVRLAWTRKLADAGHPIALSSPNLAQLAGGPAVVVGDRSGHVYALNLGDGEAVPGWPASTGGVPVDSTPSVAQLPGQVLDTVFVGAGSSATPHAGGYEAFNSNGSRRWYVAVRNPPSDAAAGLTSAVPASLAVGDLQGSLDVVAPSVGQEMYALDAATGRALTGFPWFTADSGFSTPAIADLYGNGHNEVVVGGDQTAGLAYGTRYTRGGHLRVLAATGNAGTGKPAGGLDCQYNPDQVVESSPAVGPFLAGGHLGIVVGTGAFWPGATATGTVFALGAHCQLAWSAHLDGLTGSSPALADLGLGGLSVVEGTDNGHGGGSVYALSGGDGRVLWRTTMPGEVIGSVVTVGAPAGYQDVVVPTTSGGFVLDGRTGATVATLERGVGLQSSPLVTAQPGGAGVTLAGYDNANAGEVMHFELAGWSAGGAGSWPQFHHDPRLSGVSPGPP